MCNQIKKVFWLFGAPSWRCFTYSRHGTSRWKDAKGFMDFFEKMCPGDPPVWTWFGDIWLIGMYFLVDSSHIYIYIYICTYNCAFWQFSLTHNNTLIKPTHNLCHTNPVAQFPSMNMNLSITLQVPYVSQILEYLWTKCNIQLEITAKLYIFGFHKENKGLNCILLELKRDLFIIRL